MPPIPVKCVYARVNGGIDVCMCVCVRETQRMVQGSPWLTCGYCATNHSSNQASWWNHEIGYFGCVCPDFYYLTLFYILCEWLYTVGHGYCFLVIKCGLCLESHSCHPSCKMYDGLKACLNLLVASRVAPGVFVLICGQDESADTETTTLSPICLKLCCNRITVVFFFFL